MNWMITQFIVNQEANTSLPECLQTSQRKVDDP